MTPAQPASQPATTPAQNSKNFPLDIVTTLNQILQLFYIFVTKKQKL